MADSRNRIPSSTHQKDSDTAKLKLLSMIADEVAIHLCGLTKSFQNPLPCSIRGLGVFEGNEGKDKMIFIAEFQDSSNTLTRNNKALMVSAAEKYLKKHHPKLRLKIEASTSVYQSVVENSDEPRQDGERQGLDEEVVMNRFASQIAQLAEFFECPDFSEALESKSSSREKLAFLRTYFIETILSIDEIEKQFVVGNPNQEFRILSLLTQMKYSVLTKLNRLNSGILDLLEVTHKRSLRLVNINNKAYNANQTDFKMQLSEATDTEKAISLYANGLASLDLTMFKSRMDAWSRYSCYYSIIQDALEALILQENQIQKIKLEYLTYLALLEKCEKVFQGLTEPELHFILGDYDKIISLKTIQLNLAEIRDQKATFEKAYDEHKNHILCFKYILKFTHSFLKKHFQDCFYFEENEPEEFENPFSNSSVVSTSTNSFFSTSLTSQLSRPPASTVDGRVNVSSIHDYVGLSDKTSTHEYKKIAQEKIQQAEMAAEARKNRAPVSNRSEVSNKIPENEKSNEAESSDLILNVETKHQAHTIHCSPISKSLNLYFSFDIDIYPMDEFTSFKKTALNEKKLQRSNLGSPGVKIYGLNCMIVKNKQYPGKHLLCIAHPIPGSEGYVYLPYQIITHERYETLIKNEAELERVANQARASVTIFSEHKNTLKI